MNAARFTAPLVIIWLLSLAFSAPAPVRAQTNGWSEPYRLSSDGGKAGDASCVADQFGYAHCFWTERLFDAQETIVQYARFDGNTWSAPNDIYFTGATISNVSAVVDRQDRIHIAWAEGLDGPAYYMHAHSLDAHSVQNWSLPLRIDMAARKLLLQVDAANGLHMLYSRQAEEETGVYYRRSVDEGLTWTEPIWLDPDIPAGHTPDSLNFQLDETGGLHALWFYGADDPAARPDWIRYTRSLDGGSRWSPPFTIDAYSEANEHYLNAAGPIMTVAGETVHVIWAAGSLPYRYHRHSSDAGATWSPPKRIFGDLHGQAGDTMAVDGAGRVHFLGQIRYPIAIYHSVWSAADWSPPALIYLIAQQDVAESNGRRIHAHGLNPVVRAGNQLVLTFGDGPAEPDRRLFAMVRTLPDVAPLAPLSAPAPLPTPAPAVLPETDQEPEPSAPTPPLPQFQAADNQAPSVPAPNHALRVALLPTALVIGAAVVAHLLRNSFKSSLLRSPASKRE